MKKDISDFLLGSLVEMNKYIEVADGNFIKEKQKREVQIKLPDDNVKIFIYTL